jgi:hypothetical protein
MVIKVVTQDTSCVTTLLSLTVVDSSVGRTLSFSQEARTFIRFIIDL